MRSRHDLRRPRTTSPWVRVAGVVAVVIVAWACWVAWQAWHIERDLSQAVSDARALRSAAEADEAAGVDAALADLRTHSTRAADRANGVAWKTLTWLPLVGDDAEGIQVVSNVAADLSTSGVEPLMRMVTDAERLVPRNGRVPIGALESLHPDVAQGATSFSKAETRLESQDPSGFVGRLDERYRDISDQITASAAALRSADTALEVLPQMLGRDGQRNYLLVFQNNAEIRATGGLPGSWAHISAVDGDIDMLEQGTGAFGGPRDTPLPISPAERTVYNEQFGVYFQDANFTPDFPRAAELMATRWEEEIGTVELDGVMAIDPVAMSYLLEGTGPVEVSGRTLTGDNVVEELLSRPYKELEPAAQDAFFQAAARQVFTAVTEDVRSPLALVEGLHRAAGEGRLLVAPFDDETESQLAGSRVLGALMGEDGETPHVDIGLNDATASKMSYYLRHRAEIESVGCSDGTQVLAGSLSLQQSISPRAAAELPVSVTGRGEFGTERGSQRVNVRLYGPWGGSIDSLQVEGHRVDNTIQVVPLAGRPVLTFPIVLSNRDDVVVTYAMTTGPGQTGAGEVGVTPGVLPGSKDSTVPSSC